MNEVSGEENAIIARLSPVLENLIQSNSLFQELDQDKMLTNLSILLGETFSSEDLRAMSDDILIPRIRGILAVEVMSKLISDFTPEEISEFNAAVAKKDWQSSIFLR